MSSTQFDVFFYEAFQEEVIFLKRYLKKNIRAGFSSKTIQENKDPSPPSTLISVRTQSVIPDRWSLELRGILSRSTGYEHLLRYREGNGLSLPCGYLPLYCSKSVAEQALLLWMALMRKLPQQMRQFKTFNRNGLTGLECFGKTLLVVGVGHMGVEIARLGEALGMKILGVDIVRKHPSISYVSIDKGLSEADVIVCAMNLTSDNLDYFSYSRLKKVKKGAIFINVARGELSPSSDLLKLLREGCLGGVGLDVFDKEETLSRILRSQKRSHDPELRSAAQLSKHPFVICTPHNAFNTLEALDRKAQQSVRQIRCFLEKGRFIWPIPFYGPEGSKPHH